MKDELFTTTEIRGTIEDGVSLETAWNIGKALADWLPTYGKIALSRGADSEEVLVKALIEGLRLQGRDVVDCGQSDDLQLAGTIAQQGYSGGVLVGHDSQQDQCVIKLFDDKSQQIGAENGLIDIEQLVRGGNFVPAATKGELTAVA